MGLEAISAVSAAARSMAVDPTGGLPSLPSVDGTAGTGAAGGANNFGDMVAGALEQVNGLHQQADHLAVQAATGDLADVHEYTIAATQAEIATQLTVAVRDRAVEAFNDIMRMQV